jgi:phytol kinase
VSVAALILVTGDSPLEYVIPILILSLADAAAAIFGRLIPSQPLTGWLRGKSVAAVICGVALAFYTQLPALQILTCSLFVAAATCLAEAVCRNGLDNLIVPFTAWTVLVLLQL